MFNYTNNIVNELEIKNITFTNEDVNLTNLTITENIEVSNVNNNKALKILKYYFHMTKWPNNN